LLNWILSCWLDDLICLETACDFHSFYALEIRESTRERVRLLHKRRYCT
jgi:hypothetical protein